MTVFNCLISSTSRLSNFKRAVSVTTGTREKIPKIKTKKSRVKFSVLTRSDEVANLMPMSKYEVQCLNEKLPRSENTRFGLKKDSRHLIDHRMPRKSADK
ncbi:hypothetical protein NPIL_541251 [Nephila pilipes]|uniref:Uncharacterized protein n=1 Tax=Nephila pilipes TaxID=299642 RepID=A0A8X6Q1S3_NEPPI|nr:hypothetical protein NPIL_211251 [Nephila pilipes]GFU49360.1 hypothetical protein NPIL_541251 [Nephila pilipes]